MRIVIGFIFVLFGLVFMTSSIYRLQQVGETLLVYPLPSGSATLRQLDLSPSMNPVEIKAEGFWTLRQPTPNRPMKVTVRITDEQNSSPWVREVVFDGTEKSASLRAPKRMRDVKVLGVLQVEKKGEYRIDLQMSPGSVHAGRVKFSIDVNAFDPSWEVPIVFGLLLLCGLILIVWGLFARYR